MRITREMLLKLAKDTTEKRFKPDPHVVAVFLVGSMRNDGDPLLGGTADIDLLVITKGEPLREREIVKVSTEIHFDLMFESEKAYAKPRELRGDPWRGWAMWDPMLLHEKGRFFEYTQSSLRAQFDDPVNILARSRALANRAREAWTGFQFGGEPNPGQYLAAVQDAGNSVAVLSGAPLPERRFIPAFSEKAKKAGRPELSNTLATMLGGLDVSPDDIRAWLGPWETTFETAAQSPAIDGRIHMARLAYYKNAILAALAANESTQALWLILHSWSLATQAGNLSIEQVETWNAASKFAGLRGPSFETRLQSMDHFLDAVDEMLDKMSTQYGL
jgi:predicted nucleotidyltransferase